MCQGRWLEVCDLRLQLAHFGAWLPAPIRGRHRSITLGFAELEPVLYGVAVALAGECERVEREAVQEADAEPPTRTSHPPPNWRG